MHEHNSPVSLAERTRSVQPSDEHRQGAMEEIEVSGLEHSVHANIRRLQKLKGEKYTEKFIDSLPLVF